MKKLVYVEEARKNEIISAAIEREAICVITSRGEVGWQTRKSRMLSEENVVGRLLLAMPQGACSEKVPEYRPGERVGVSFRRGHKKCMFATIVLGPGPVDLGRSDSNAKCMELQWPEALQELQRRVYYRATPPGRRIHVRFWPGGVARRPAADSEGRGILSGILLDLSAGGMRVVTTDVGADTFSEGETIGCSFTPKPRGEPLVLDAIYRHFQREDNGTFSVGIQFVGLETSEEGRQTLACLASIVTDYQRGHARQQRTHLAGRFVPS